VGIAFGALHGLTLGLLFVLAYRVLDGARGERFILSSVAAAVGAWGPVLVGATGSSSSDLLLGLLNLLALCFAVSGLKAPEGVDDVGFGFRARLRALFSAPAVRWCAIAGLLSGAAAGMKLVELMYSVALGTAVLLASRARWLRNAIVTAVAT